MISTLRLLSHDRHGDKRSHKRELPQVPRKMTNQRVLRQIIPPLHRNKESSTLPMPRKNAAPHMCLLDSDNIHIATREPGEAWT
jgi:hypothetical protein